MAAKEGFIDFDAIKEQVSIEQACAYLGLRLPNKDQAKLDCPACDSAGALAINKTKGKFFCHSKESGGDVVALVAHIKGIRQLEAAKLMKRDLLGNGTATMPVRENRTSTATATSSRRRERQEEQQEPEPATKGIDPLDYLAADHDAVQELGFDPDDAGAIGIGFATKGMLRGLVAIPLRTETGVLVGYFGAADGRVGKLHIEKPNIVPFAKKRA